MARSGLITAIALVATGGAIIGCSHQASTSVATPGVGLYFNQSGGAATLAYGRANSDDVGLVLQCQAGSRQVDVSDVARTGRASPLTLTSGKASTRLSTRVETTTGQPTLWARTSMHASALSAFRKTGKITVAADRAGYGVVASRSEQAGVEAFFKACERA